MCPGRAYDDAMLLEEARREVAREESRIQDSMRTIRWWATGCLVVITLHVAIPFGLLTGLDDLAALRVAFFAFVSLCVWAWVVWGSVHRLRPRNRPARPERMRQAYQRGEAVDARPALIEIWGDPDNPDTDEGVMSVLTAEADALDQNAVEVYNRVRQACVLTVVFAIFAMFAAASGLPG